MTIIGSHFTQRLSAFIGGRRRGHAIAIAVYLSCAVIGSAWVLLQPGTLGHHWDWIVPASPVELRKLTTTNFYAWQDFSLGSFVSYRYTTTLMSMLLGIPGFFGLGGAFVTKSLVIGSLAGSSFAMYLLVRSILEERLGVGDYRYALGAGLLYGFSPFAYNQIVAGDQLEMISFALAPLLLLSVLKATTKEHSNRIPAIVAAAALTAIMSASPQTVAIALAVAVFLLVAIERPLKSAALGCFAIVLLALPLCAYWILPVTLGGEALVEGVATTPQLFADYSFREMSSLFQSLTTAAEPGEFYFRALPGPLYWAFAAAWLALWGMIARALNLQRHRLTVSLAALYVGGALLPLGGAPIIGPIILAAFKATQPASLLFRTAQHLVFLPTLVIGPLAAAASAQLGILDQKRFRVAAIACVVAISGAFITHSNYLALIGPFEKSASEETATQYVAQRGSRGRLLFIPTSGAYYYHPGVFDYFFEGGDDGAVRFAPLPTLAPGFKWSPYHNGQTVQKAVDELMTQPGRGNQQRLLSSLTSVHYVEARAGVVPAGGVFVGQYDYREAAKTLGSLPFLRKVSGDSHASLWAVVKPTDRIYAPDCTIGVDPRADPYDLLAWADEVTNCNAPAFIAGSTSEEVVVSASDVKTPHVGVGTPMRFGHQTTPLNVIPVSGGSNVSVQANPDGTVTADPQNPYYVILCHIKDVKPIPKIAGADTHFLLPITVPETGPYLISFLAPDWKNRFGAQVLLHQGSQVVKFDLARLGKEGNARLDAVTTLRIANVNPRLVYFGTLELGDLYEYFSDWDLPFSLNDSLYRPSYEHGNVAATNWYGSNGPVALTSDGGASIHAPAPYFVFETDLTSTDSLSRTPDGVRLYLTINTPYAGQYLVSLLAPDWSHRFDLMMALPSGQSSTSISPRLMPKFGDPRIEDIRRFRLANVTPIPHAADVTIRPPVTYNDARSHRPGSPETVAQATWNRWDLYYYGDLQHRLALRNTLTYRVRGLSAAFDIRWAAQYRLYFHVQTRADSQPFSVSVDNGPQKCIDLRSPLDRTEDLVLAAEPMLTPGRHVVHINTCSGTSGVGDLSIVSLDIVPDLPVAPAPRPSTIKTLEETPGRFTLTVSADRPTYVVFNDSYDPRWIATQGGRVIDHLHANGYANAWLIEHPDKGPIELRFQPQVYLNAGYLVSALSFVFSLGLVFVPAVWRRIHE